LISGGFLFDLVDTREVYYGKAFDDPAFSRRNWDALLSFWAANVVLMDVSESSETREMRNIRASKSLSGRLRCGEGQAVLERQVANGEVRTNGVIIISAWPPEKCKGR